MKDATPKPGDPKTDQPKTDQPGARQYRRGMEATMQDVANAAGVSIITVSRAFRHPEQVSESTQRRIRKAVRQTGYLPNISARSLVSRRSNIVGAVVPAIDNPVYSEMVSGLAEELRKHGVHILIGNTEHRSESEPSAIHALLARRPDGLVLTGTHQQPAERRLLKNSRVPMVETWDLSDNAIDMAVGFDNYAALYDVGRHILEKGYRKIAVASGFMQQYGRLGLRLKGLKKALSENREHLADPLVFEMPTRIGSGAEIVRRIAAERLDIDILVCFGDVFAIGAVLECNRLGIDVPGRLAVTGFGDFEHAALLNPALTTVRVPARQIGIESARLLWGRLNGEPIEDRVDVGYRLITREST